MSREHLNLAFTSLATSSLPTVRRDSNRQIVPQRGQRSPAEWSHAPIDAHMIPAGVDQTLPVSVEAGQTLVMLVPLGSEDAYVEFNGDRMQQQR
jgi:hypothetical protein